MKRHLVLLFAALALMIVASHPALATITGVGGILLGPADQYSLIGIPIVATGGPAPINPGVLVGLNPQPLPPLPDPNVSLNLGDPGGPVYTYPATAGTFQVFQIDWGMNAGGAVSFKPPTPGPDPGQFQFTGTGPTGDPYLITFTITGANPGSFVELNPQPLPPFPADFGAEIFGFTSGGDPTLTFTVTSGGTTFGFAPTPEPSSLMLLGTGLFGLAGVLRRKLLA